MITRKIEVPPGVGPCIACGAAAGEPCSPRCGMRWIQQPQRDEASELRIAIGRVLERWQLELVRARIAEPPDPALALLGQHIDEIKGAVCTCAAPEREREMVSRRIEVPRCVRGDHYCDELCAVAHGQPCEGPGWRPRGGTGLGSAVANYRVLRAALPPGELTSYQERQLRWLAQFDNDTAQAFAELFRVAAGQ